MAIELSVNHCQRPPLGKHSSRRWAPQSEHILGCWDGARMEHLYVLFVQIKYILGTNGMAFITASPFYCISKDGWRACDTVIYSPSAFCGKALEGCADIEPVL